MSAPLSPGSLNTASDSIAKARRDLTRGEAQQMANGGIHQGIFGEYTSDQLAAAIYAIGGPRMGATERFLIDGSVAQ